MDTKTFYHNRQFGIQTRGKDTLLKAKRLPYLTRKTIHVSLTYLLWGTQKQAYYEVLNCSSGNEVIILFLTGSTTTRSFSSPLVPTLRPKSFS